VPFLENERHELFAQQLAQGKSASEAYVLAGFKPSRHNASRLRTKSNICARVREIQEASAKSAEINIASICRELDSAIEIARARGQANAMVSAAGLRAKLAGLMVERHEIGAPGDFEDCNTEEEVLRALLVRLSGTSEIEVTDGDRARVAELMKGFEQLAAEIAARSAKLVPAVPSVDPREVERRKMIAERRRLFNGGNGPAR
jgi:phage terminase small subunit